MGEEVSHTQTMTVDVYLRNPLSVWLHFVIVGLFTYSRCTNNLLIVTKAGHLSEHIDVMTTGHYPAVRCQSHEFRPMHQKKKKKTRRVLKLRVARCKNHY